MVTIGLTGGVASGKSAVAAALARRGAVVFDADKIGHRMLTQPEVRDALLARWGPTILGTDGQISRPAVAQRVFGEGAKPTAERKFLQETLHGRIRRQIEADIARLASEGVPAVVIDAPLLLEAGWGDACQVVAFVDSAQEKRRARAAARGWTAEEFARRESAQLPIEEKKRRSTHVIKNSGTLADLEVETDRFWAAAAK